MQKKQYFCISIIHVPIILSYNMEIIDELDKKILTIITQNARIPFKDVAEQCGVSRAAVHQRVK